MISFFKTSSCLRSWITIYPNKPNSKRTIPTIVKIIILTVLLFPLLFNITFKESISSDETMKSIEELRSLTDKQCKISGMSATVLDTRDLSNSEIVIYVVIAVALCIGILLLALDSYIAPIFLLLNIGIAILYNMGTNIFLGQISYITKAITAILQLGVTTDFSIFLYHKYQQAKKHQPDKKQAMEVAIKETFTSVIGSSLTTFAGFLALCTMDLTLGVDIGIVMAKGVVCGLICVLTLFPALLLVFDKLIEKTKHRNIFPEFNFLRKFSVKKRHIALILLVILMIPAYIGNSNYEVYYNLDKSLPEDLPFHLANKELAEKFNIVSPEIILLDKKVKEDKIETLVSDIKELDGIDFVVTPSTLMNSDMIGILPDELVEVLDNDKYQLILVNSTYGVATNELNDQIDKINNIVRKYDKNGIVAGEGALMTDLVTIADHDFKMVNYTSIIVIFIIMILVLKSISLPIILTITIEFAIFLNMAFAYYTGEALPFVASIIVGTIQLGLLHQHYVSLLQLSGLLYILR